MMCMYSVVGLQHRFVYSSLGADPVKPSPLKALIKVDLQSKQETRWYTEPYEYMGEPVFATKAVSGSDAAAAASTKEEKEEGKEDDGYLLTYLWNGRDQRTELLVFDARDISQGPLRRLPVPVKIGHGLHGSYVPDLVFDSHEMQRKFSASGDQL